MPPNSGLETNRHFCAMQRLCIVAKCIHVELMRDKQLKSDEFKVLESRLMANDLVLESLIVRLHAKGILPAHDVIKDIDEILAAPTSINADTLNLRTMRESLSNWKIYILELLKKV
jgi:hypothetical protein